MNDTRCGLVASDSVERATHHVGVTETLDVWRRFDHDSRICHNRAMKRIAWLTDIHLNFLRPPALDAFLDMLAGTEADAFAISGDIGEADDVAIHLHNIGERVERPVYFVLGNHDFYRGSIAGVREKIRGLCSVTSNLDWMPDAGVVPLTDEACLIGHDGWSDGRFGNYHNSDVMLNDFGLIEEFGGFEETRTIGSPSCMHSVMKLPRISERCCQMH